MELLCAWEGQREYERIRPLVLFGEPIPERAVQTGTSERTLYRRIAGFEEDGRRSPSDVLGSLTLVRHHPGDLERAFFSTMFVRRLDVLGYARLKHWRIYGEEGLARCEVAVWLGDDGLVVEYGGEKTSNPQRA